jgi:hypothetical protein
LKDAYAASRLSQEEDSERRNRRDAAFDEGGRISELVGNHANNNPADRSSRKYT